jgi:hypothetical protein
MAAESPQLNPDPEIEALLGKAIDIVATPASSALDSVRRAFGREKGEPVRPLAPPLGRRRGEIALGEQPDYQYFRERDGDQDAWRAREDAKAALRAEAQRAWEGSARAEAEAWAAGLPAHAADTNAEAEGDPAPDGSPIHTPTGDEA